MIEHHSMVVSVANLRRRDLLSEVERGRLAAQASQSTSRLGKSVLPRKRSHSAARPLRKPIQKLLFGLLATSLLVSMGPAMAAKPHTARIVAHEQSDLSVTKQRKGRKGKTITRTFATDGPISVPALLSPNEFGPAHPYPSVFAVSGFRKAKITDVNVILEGFSHTFPGDVSIRLVSPDERTAILLGDVGDPPGDPAVSGLTIRLDDEADAPLPADMPLTSGTFRPANYGGIISFPDPAPDIEDTNVKLSIFDGGNPNGTWQLFVQDTESGGIGNIDSVMLEITAKRKRRH